MLENIVAWVLNTYIGEYLEDLNTNQLSLALLSGQLELENVPLKKTALKKFDLPLEVKSGLLGRLTLSVPLTRIRSEPWTLTLSDVLIIVGPLSAEQKYDMQVVEEMEQQKKDSLLSDVEQKHKNELASLLGIPQTATQDTWWGASIISTVLNNIQLIMTNVHVRYEDGTTLPRGLAFNCGVRIQKMTVQTTNSTWKPGFIEPQEGHNVFKKLELKGFSLYWNSEQTISTEVMDASQLRNILAPENMNNSYIIHPCSGELRMERNSSKYPLKTEPRFKLFLKPDKIVCELTRRQMAELRALNREWGRFEIARQHRKWRPLTTVGAHASEWWKFAYGRIIDEQKKDNVRKTWTFAFTRAQQLNAYCRAYRRRLKEFCDQKDVSVENPTQSANVSAIVSQEDKTIMKQIERDADYTFQELQLFRETVFRQVLAEKEKELGFPNKADDNFETLESPGDVSTEIDALSQSKQEGKGFYGWITSFFVSEQPKNEEHDFNAEFSKIDLSELKNLKPSFNVKEMEDEIRDVLHESWDDSTIFRRDTILADIALRLDHVTLRFIDSCVVSNIEQRRILVLDCTGVSSQLELSPRQHAMSVQLAVEDMSVQRLYTGYPPSPVDDISDDSLFYSAAEQTKILLAVGRREGKCGSQKEPIFRLRYRRFAPKTTVRHTVEGRFRPISVMYEENAFDGLSTLFTDDPNIYKTVDNLLSSESYGDDLTESQIFVNLHIPVITMELRQQGWVSPRLREFDAGEPFVCVELHDVGFGVSSKEKHLSQIKIDIGHAEMKDLLERNPLSKASNYLILNTGKRSDSYTKSFPNSCPDITQFGVDPVQAAESSSVPTQSYLSNLCQIHQPSRKISAFESNNAETQILVTLIDSKHPLFDSKYKSNCKVDVVMNELSIGMNRRTWTAVMDLMGLLGSNTSSKTEKTEVPVEVLNAFTIECSVRLEKMVVDMIYPVNATRLGLIHFTKPELLTKVTVKPEGGVIYATLLLEGFRIEDHMPLYSELYQERMYAINEGGIIPSRAEFRITKYMGSDAQRDCDLKVVIHVPKTMHIYYVHTHRFFSALLEFWMHFNELQEIVGKTRKRNVAVSTRLTRVLLDIDISCPTTLIFPLNQFSEQVVIMECTNIAVRNSFVNLSDVEEYFSEHSIETDYGYDENIDCLLDSSKITLSNLTSYEGLRVAKIGEREEKSNLGPNVSRGVFKHCEFRLLTKNIFDRNFNVLAEIYRNLDGATSHNAPDMTIIVVVSDLRWSVTTDFYILFRGFLEKNMADPLIPVPDTIPLEILQKPSGGCEVLNYKKYATLSFRLLFKDIILDCRVPDQNTYMPFAEANLRKAQLSFDIFIDGQSELDVISESTELVDTRIGTEKNLFSTILRPIDNIPDDSPLMFEAHMILKQDEIPQLTLVLMNSRVIVLPEWLNDSKDFLNLSTSFTPKFWEDIPQLQMMGGVVSRLSNVHQSNQTPQQTLAVKITLKNSSLYFLENPSDPHSFACIATATAVLNICDPGGEINANLEVSNLNFGWCAMQEETHTTNLCSNDFSLGITLSALPNTVSIIPGLPQLSTSKNHLEIELRGIIGRLAYRDAIVLNTAIRGFMKHFETHFGKTLIPVMKHQIPAKPIHIDKITARAENLDLWLLDEYAGVSVPLLRLSLSDLFFEKLADRITSRFHVSADYFNNKVFGWEPLLEKWKILRFLCQIKDKLRIVELITETTSTLDITLTEQVMQQTVQFLDRLPAIRSSLLNDDFRDVCIKTKVDHLPYIIKNETGVDLAYHTALEVSPQNIPKSRKDNVHNIRWVSLPSGKTQHFAFPSKQLLYKQSEKEPPRQLLLKVAGWDEISHISVDASGTYFRVIRNPKSGLPSARLIIRVKMEKDGRKLVTVRSSMDITNSLPHPIQVFVNNGSREIMTIEPSTTVAVPLPYAHHSFHVLPMGPIQIKDKVEIVWKGLQTPGETRNKTEKLSTSNKALSYWICTSAKREYYPEDESIPGHALTVLAPLSLQNLLPVDIEVKVQDQIFAISAGKIAQITSVDVTRDVDLTVSTDRLRSVAHYTVSRSTIGQGQLLSMRLRDKHGRCLDLYGNVKFGTGSSFIISFWVPYWIVNKSGIPLVIKQEAAEGDAAGQMEEHENAKDKNPLMFSFADEGCPSQCVVRVGRRFVKELGYSPKYSGRFSLMPGVQAIKLKLEHQTLPTLYYNIGVEVRAGTGRYKDTQVVLLTSRFLLNNQSSHSLYVCHHDLIDRPSEHILLSAQSTLVWNEKVENQRMLCVRRADVRFWSCPFRIDRVGSFHVTMRDLDETPHFIRVEIALSSAVFCVTFTDASYYPPPIRIENLSDVPVLYQQKSESLIRNHLRSICKANSHIDYAWDDIYGTKLIVLQVYENKSHDYDPSITGTGSKLVYENYSFIQLICSFNEIARIRNHTEEYELVLETLQKGKVVLNKQNKIDGNSWNQLWRLCDDGCIENIGMSARNRKRMVLEMLDKMGNQLLMAERSSQRDKFQKWIFSPDGRLSLQHFPKLMLTARGTDVFMREHDTNCALNEDGVAISQQWKCCRQRPGSGTLCVECLHRGPTMIIQIRDEEKSFRSQKKIPSKAAAGEATDITVTMRSGLGISLVNGQGEELLYAYFGGILAHGRAVDNSYQTTVSVDLIQIDNQLLDAENYKVLFCQAETLEESHLELPPGIPSVSIPALKLEMYCCPQTNYTAFDCLRLKLCNLQVLLNELLLWKLVQFVQASDAAASVQEKTLSLPPNTELERPDPLRTKRLYFGTLDLEMGEISLSVVTASKMSLPPACRQLKQQFNVKLISFENATVSLPPFRQFHYFESSAFLFEAMQKFYFAELQKQTVKFVFTLDAFGNPQGFLTEMKDSFQGLIIEGDVQRFVAGVGYGVSNSISKMASSLSSGVGSLTFDQNHEARRRNMVRSQSASSTPLTHLYSGVKGLGIGVLGGMSAIAMNTFHEGKKSGISGALKGIATGAMDTVTKPVQGIFDLVEGTASAMKAVAGSGVTQNKGLTSRVRLPRVSRDLYHLLPPYSEQLAKAQMEMMRINGFSTSERLLDMEICLEQIVDVDHIVCQYALISNNQVYICKQEKGEPSTVIQRLAYKYIKSVQAQPELANTLARIEITIESYDRHASLRTIWCSRFEVARRLAEKLLRAKHEYDHYKRTLLFHSTE